MEKYWPIALIVISNVFYNICSKKTPSNVDPFASLTLTYAIGAVVSAAMFFALNRGGNLAAEYHRINWTSIVLGVAIVGLEAGSIYMYKAGWSLGTGQIVYSSILAVILMTIGFVFYREPVTFKKIAGMAVCIGGLFLINS